MKVNMPLLIVLAGLCFIVISPLAAQWSYTGELQIARSYHTATLLKDGRVLIAGGGEVKAELYNPNTGSFNLTGSTKKNFYQGSSATLLPDGRVLLAGGINSQKYAEIYNPATGVFTPTDSMATDHCYHTATLLADGRVLIAAGQHQQGPQTHAVAEIYDPATGAFTTTGSLSTDRSGHAAALLPDGRVLIAGGLQTTTPGFGIGLRSCEIFSPGSGLFTAAAEMTPTRSNFSLCPLPDGRVLAAGSFSAGQCEIFDPQTGYWTPAGVMAAERRRGHQFVTFANGKILLVGGLIPTITRSVELYDPVQGTFAFVDSLNTPRYGHTATLLKDGRVLVTGGYSGSAKIKTAELITPAALGIAVLDPALPADYILRQNYPNPFNSRTTVEYALLEPGMVAIQVLDLMGKTVATLDQGIRQTGVHRVHWSGCDADGREMPSGFYFLRLTGSSFSQSRKMLLLR
ncbi:MAG TPA: FlgD immunoglobulin-like domain containing protein [bacterium]|nr:FlgD immunoglobulin-like domain containing protein [bacterium]